MKIHSREPAEEAGLSRFGRCLLVSLAGLLLSTTQSTAQIQDEVVFTLSFLRVQENAGSIEVEVRRTADFSSSLEVRYAALAAGTGASYAEPGVDFEAVDGLLAFSAGQERATFEVPVFNDGLTEGDEVFWVQLRDENGALLPGEGAQRTVTIADNDRGLEFRQLVTKRVSETNSSVVFLVRRGNDGPGEMQVDFATRDVTATAGEDYVARSGTLVFAESDFEKPIEIELLDDPFNEPEESFEIELTFDHPEYSMGRYPVATAILLDDDPGVQFVTEDHVQLGEAHGVHEIVVIRGEPLDGTVEVDLVVEERGAVSGEDYQLTGGRLTFAPGETEKRIPVTILNDPWQEEFEQLFLKLENATGNGSLGEPVQFVLSILDNDQRTRWDSHPLSAAETAGAIPLRILRGGDLEMDYEAGYRTVDVSAMAGSDYAGLNGVILFEAGKTFHDIELQLLNDSEREGTESLRLEIFNPQAPEKIQDVFTFTIVDNDTGPEWTRATGYSPQENAGEIRAEIRRANDTQSPITVRYETRSGSAKAGVDFVGFTNVLVMPPELETQEIPITILNDGQFEANETFQLLLTDITGDPVLLDVLTVTIRDNDYGFSWGFGNYGEESDAAARLAVFRGNDGTNVISVEYRTIDGTAVAGEDYVATSGILEFPPGTEQLEVAVPLINDGVPETDEQFELELFNPSEGAAILRSTTSFQINDNDFGIQWSSSLYHFSETNGTVQVEVYRRTDGTNTVSLDYQTFDDDATAGEDYIAASGTLTFPPGVESRTIELQLINDDLVEGPNEAFRVVLSGGGGELAPNGASTLVGIRDNDTGVQFSSAFRHVQETEPTAEVTVTRRGDFPGTITVDYATEDQTALAGEDYTSVSGTLEFGQDEIYKTISIPILNEGLIEAEERFLVRLFNFSEPAQAGENTEMTLQLFSNDEPAKVIVSGPVYEDELEVRFVVERGNDGTNFFSVDYETADIFALAGQDYEPVTGTLVFEGDIERQVVAVPLINDAIQEETESFELRLSNPVGEGDVSGSKAQVQILDNDTGIQLGAPFYRVWERDGAALIIVDRGPDRKGPMSVSWSTTDVTAQEGIDYFGSSGVIHFTGDERCQRLLLPLAPDDDVAEPDRVFRIELPGYSNGGLSPQAVASVQIEDDDTSVVYAEPVRVRETNGVATMRVSREHALDQAVEVSWKTVNQTARAGEDYEAAEGSIRFEAGEHLAVVELTVLDDSVEEVELETMQVVFSVVSGEARMWSGIVPVEIDSRETQMNGPDRILGYGQLMDWDVTSDAAYLTTSTSTGAWLWDLQGGSLLQSFEERIPIDAVVVPSRAMVAILGGGRVELRRIETGDLAQTLVVNGSGLELSRDERFLAVSSGDNAISIWDLENALPVRTQADRLFGLGIRMNLQVSPDGRHAIHSYKQGLVLRSLASGYPVMAIRDGTDNASFSTDGGRLVLPQSGRMLDLERHEWVGGFPSFEFAVASDMGSVLVGNQGGTILAMKSDGMMEVWRYTHERRVGQLAVSPDGSQLAAALEETGDDYGPAWEVNLVELDSGSLTPFTQSRLQQFEMEFSPDSHKLAIGTQIWPSHYNRRYSVAVFDLSAVSDPYNGSMIWGRSGYSPIHSLEYSKNGLRILVHHKFGIEILTNFGMNLWNTNVHGDSSAIVDDLNEIVVVAPNAIEIFRLEGIPDYLVQGWPDTYIDTIQDLHFFESGELIIRTGKSVQLLESVSGNLISEVPAHSSAPVAFGSTLIALERFNRVQVRRLDTAQIVATINPNNNFSELFEFSGLFLSSDDTELLVEFADRQPGTDSEYAIYHIPGGSLVHLEPEHDAFERSIGGFLSATHQLITYDRDRLNLHLIDLESNQVVSSFAGFTKKQSTLASAKTSPDGQRLLTAQQYSTDGYRNDRGQVVIWDLIEGQPLKFFRGKDVRVDRDWSRLVVERPINWGSEWDVFNLETMQLEGTYGRTAERTVVDVTLSNDGQWLAAWGQDAGEEPMIWLWAANSGELRRSWSFAGDSVVCLGFSPNDDWLLVFRITDGSGSYQMLNRLTDETVTFPDGDSTYPNARFSPDGSRLLTGGHDLDLWDTVTGDLIAHWEGSSFSPRSYTFSPDSRSVFYLERSGQYSGGYTFHLYEMDALTGEALDSYEVPGWQGYFAVSSDHILVDNFLLDRNGRFIRQIGFERWEAFFSADGLQVFTETEERIGLWDISDLIRLRLRLMAMPEGLHLDWGEGTLQYAPEVQGPWTDLPTVNPPWRMPSGGPKGFFRVKEE